MKSVRPPVIILVTLAIAVFAISALTVGWNSSSAATTSLVERDAFERVPVDTTQASRRITAFGHWGRASSILVEDETVTEQDVEIRMLGVTTIDGERQALLSVDTTTLEAIEGGDRLSLGILRVSEGDELTRTIAVGWIAADSMGLIVDGTPQELFLYPEE